MTAGGRAFKLLTGRLYKILRSVFVGAVVLVATLYACLYVVLNMPWAQDEIRGVVESEMRVFLKSRVDIGGLEIIPFNEVRLYGVDVYTPGGEECVHVDRVGAGILVWKLLVDRKIELSYAEIIGLDGRIWKESAKSGLNISFIIDAFKPKEPKKKPKPFDLVIHNVLIRKSTLSYDERWKGKNEDGRKFDASHIKIERLRADIAIPVLRNDDFRFDVRSISFRERCGFEVERTGFIAHLGGERGSLKNFFVRLPNSEVKVNDITLRYDSLKNIGGSFLKGGHRIEFSSDRLTPSDFSAFYLPLSGLDRSYSAKGAVIGTLDKFRVEGLSVFRPNGGLRFSFKGDLENVRSLGKRGMIKVDELRLAVNRVECLRLLSLFPRLSPEVFRRQGEAGDIRVRAHGVVDFGAGIVDAETDLGCGYGELWAEGRVGWKQGVDVKGNFEVPVAHLGMICGDSRLKDASFRGSVGITKAAGAGGLNSLNGGVNLEVGYLDYNGIRISDIVADVQKEGSEISGDFGVHDKFAELSGKGILVLDGEDSSVELSAIVGHISPGELGLISGEDKIKVGGKMDLFLRGKNLDNVTGTLNFRDLGFQSERRRLSIPRVSLMAYNTGRTRNFALRSDQVEADVVGDFRVERLKALAMSLFGASLPTLHSGGDVWEGSEDSANLRVRIHPDEPFSDFFKLPFAAGSEIEFNAYANCETGSISGNLNAPYIIQGGNKLIKHTGVDFSADVSRGLLVNVYSQYPVKKRYVDLKLKLTAFGDRVTTNVSWDLGKESGVSGELDLSGYARRNLFNGGTDLLAYVMPSTIHINNADWQISRSTISYSSGILNVDNLRVSKVESSDSGEEEKQFVSISGRASKSESDILHVNLANIDLSYIFDTLNINSVDFGGIATGNVRASNVFSRRPLLRTDLLYVRDFSYNKAKLGNANIRSYWDNSRKMVAINGDVVNYRNQKSTVSGGIYIGKDSLSFDFNADHMNIGLLKPFMRGFTSEVGGEASGHLKLFGTFSDLDLMGRTYADSLYMKVDFTNVTYHCSDSVIFAPGRILIPKLKVYDPEGNWGYFRGEVSHDHFRDIRFDFRLTEAKNLLCFNTHENPSTNFYGRVYGSGGGTLSGYGSNVSLQLGLTTCANSDFTFALNNVKKAEEYSFLTFTDRGQKAEIELTEDEKFEASLMKRVNQSRDGSSHSQSHFGLELRGVITPDCRINLIMDPRNGSGISARGEGSMILGYDSDTNWVTLHGACKATEGNYRFVLGDLFLERDFKITPGSSISFDGDPMKGTLDVEATYKVNANLTDLDPSFRDDRELTRTNLPVESQVKLTGQIMNPEIRFDIDIPSVSEEVRRKVRSIISTEEMMHRQIFYLLAFNQFSSPEYMGGMGSNMSEIASLASSALSGQLSSFLGKLTDKVSLSSSIRSDKGDFSDLEMDMGFSTSLLGNRLQLNVNGGYRDPSTSSNTFVAEGDVFYKITPNGGIQAKGYSHYNDRNYTLKSSNTTQGLGLVFQKNFDSLFRNKKRKKSVLNNKKVETQHSGAVPKSGAVRNDVKSKEETEFIETEYGTF